MIEGKLQAVIDACTIHVSYTYDDNSAISCTFVYAREIHTLKFPVWNKRSFTPFLCKFHDINRDTLKYGSTDQDEDGICSVDINDTHLANIVHRTIKDCFIFLEQLIVSCPADLLDYCTWRLTKPRNSNVYEDFIEYAVCYAISTARFIVYMHPRFIIDFYINGV